MKQKILRRLGRYLLVLVIVGGLTTFLLAKYVLPYAILQPQRIHVDISPANYDCDFEHLQIHTADSIVLDGYWIKSEIAESNTTIIMVHGVGGCKEHFISLGAELAKIGVSTLLFDNRAHGLSTGEFCTYGYYEKNDVKTIVNSIYELNPDALVGVWGNSLGGAIAIQALEYDPRLKFGIIESTFTDLEQIVYDYQKRSLNGFGLRILTDYVLKNAGKIADFPPNEVKPINSVKNIHQPVFIGHGDADERITVEYGKELYRELAGKDKELYIVEGGGHMNLGGQRDGYVYYQAIMEFIVKQFPEQLTEDEF